MNTPRVYSPLDTIMSNPASFKVISSVKNADRFITKLRYEGQAEADGLTTEGTQMTLYVSTVNEHDVSKEINITPEKWEFTLSEFPHPETGEIINLKWLRVKR